MLFENSIVALASKYGLQVQHHDRIVTVLDVCVCKSTSGESGIRISFGCNGRLLVESFIYTNHFSTFSGFFSTTLFETNVADPLCLQFIEKAIVGGIRRLPLRIKIHTIWRFAAHGRLRDAWSLI